MKKVTLFFLMVLMGLPVIASGVPLVGDLDNDGQVTINDVTGLVDLLLSGNTSDVVAADINGDGIVSVNDLTDLIDNILCGNIVVTSSVDTVTAYSTTADVVCTFSQVPSGANCIVEVTEKGTNAKLTFVAVAGKEKQTVKVSGLTVNKTYDVTTYISYKGKRYDGANSIRFTTTLPSGLVSTIENASLESAVAICQFSNIDSGVECGVVIRCSSDTISFIAQSIEEAQSILMSGLTPCRQYYCYAFVRTADYYKEQSRAVIFYTDPDVLGAWDCLDQKGSSTGVQTIVLNSGRKAVITHVSGRWFLHHNPVEGSWYVHEDGTISISFSDDFQTVTQATYYQEIYHGAFDNIYFPTRIEGTLTDNYTGWSGTDHYSYGVFEMNRK